MWFIYDFIQRVYPERDRGYHLFYASNSKWILIIQNVGVRDKETITKQVKRIH